MRDLHTGYNFYSRVMIQKKHIFLVNNTEQGPDVHRVHQWHRDGCVTATGVNPATLLWLTVSQSELGIHRDAIFDRSQSTPSRWYQTGNTLENVQ